MSNNALLLIPAVAASAGACALQAVELFASLPATTHLTGLTILSTALALTGSLLIHVSSLRADRNNVTAYNTGLLRLTLLLTSWTALLHFAGKLA